MYQLQCQSLDHWFSVGQGLWGRIGWWLQGIVSLAVPLGGGVESRRHGCHQNKFRRIHCSQRFCMVERLGRQQKHLLWKNWSSLVPGVY